MGHSEEIQFLDRLQEELAQYEIPSERDFCVPGTKFRIDLYLPLLPRAALEFKTVLSPQDFGSALAQANHIQSICKNELGPTFKTLLLLFCQDAAKPEHLTEMPGGIVCVCIEGSPNSKKSAEVAASRIKAILDTYRKEVFGLGAGTIATLSAVTLAVLPTFPILGATALAPVGLLAFAGKRFSSLIRERRASDTKSRTNPLDKSSVGSLSLHYATSPPSLESVNIVTTQVATILGTFRELVPETHVVLTQEMQFLIEEFNLGHFTACAMRGGRSLESIVYELSRHWDIEIQDTTFGKLEELQKGVDRLGDLVGDFQVSPVAHREKLVIDLDKALIELIAKSMALSRAVQCEQLPSKEAQRSEQAPRPVATLLKKIQKRYGYLEGTGDNLNALFKSDPDSSRGSLITRVLRTRNRAAHADVNGKPQEIDEDCVRELLDDIASVLLRLSNVSIAIQKSLAKT